MSRAKIFQGTWTRLVPWKENDHWRTDIHKSVLDDRRLGRCRYVLKGGPTVLIPADELRRVVEGGRDRYGAKKTIWGPFNIDPTRLTIDGHQVQMKCKTGRKMLQIA